ncbi:MAG: ornithine carbamoyltransferase [Zetaproteobacteria bacterium CG12_big_fil_rev_8_21_14_0_65_55_1124]|nr:MAG: ornithine carbamoyltransferase [Zetaproteobacteria bacterium CG1_02_55_237]PIS20259.1 MAG: ornithine carbamoyltransferase [Zetaproteobacteria bacterium CG08_land_8_20_14_0_20_55_17]PIW43136.1 MAG: ornithine carbamoyltransferase [Zetaproteobacteria bacterium CG12_big_fil_rev_8_21_14_0_65_55_1124]PIY52100.1 MAG: ornithine carbamoyltransferase [Zetaproteobacteria bacterium CG_4_10_14_0_8_um_filter_55_43]PIZ38112.1 MAG: ornithine carbamoyltransferase [Zetaproteobacteria bacterium CG_4_10_14
MRHFITLLDITAEEARHILNRAAIIKRMLREGKEHKPLAGKTLGMIFDKASTRTRVSFEVGMFQLGGHALFLHSSDTQLGRGEPIEDAARVLSRMLDGIVIRTYGHDMVQRFAAHSLVPVINALTDLTHPCQILADVFTFEEHRGSIQGKTVAWIGDGNNMAHSWINGSVSFGYKLNIACPEGYSPDLKLLAAARELGADVTLSDDPLLAARDADLVTTDVWASMGQEEEQRIREKAFAGYQVDKNVMLQAQPDALFMHCLPAHRDQEVAADVIDGAQSVVWDEAENRLHAQKALLEFLLA